VTGGQRTAFRLLAVMHIIRLHFKCADGICEPGCVQYENITHEETGVGQKIEEKKHPRQW
jgi:hypothetical protein